MEKKFTGDVAFLVNEFIYRKYLMNKEQRKLSEITTPEYIVLQTALQSEKEDSIYSGKTYLRELSEKMQITIRQTSKLVSVLRDKGYVSWSHDGVGQDGTYVMITEAGKNMLQKQESHLKEYYGRVIEKFGKDNLIQLLDLMKQLDTVIVSEIEEEIEEKEMMEENDGKDSCIC